MIKFFLIFQRKIAEDRGFGGESDKGKESDESIDDDWASRMSRDQSSSGEAVFTEELVETSAVTSTVAQN